MTSAGLSFLLADADDAEQRARLRELRALAVVFLGFKHPATIALNEAVADPAMGEHALALVDSLPSRRRRRLLATFGVLLPGGRPPVQARGRS